MIQLRNQNPNLAFLTILTTAGGIEFCVQHLHGVFAFILADVINNKVFFARDTFGVRPLFSLEQLQGSEWPGFTVVGSEVKSLMTAHRSCPEGTATVKIHLPGESIFRLFYLFVGNELWLSVCTHRVISDRVHRLLVTLSYFRSDRFVQLLSLLLYLLYLTLISPSLNRSSVYWVSRVSSWWLSRRRTTVV